MLCDQTQVPPVRAIKTKVIHTEPCERPIGQISRHTAIPFDHRLVTYHEDGVFYEICRPVGDGALSGWPNPTGKYKGKWASTSRARMLTCFYSAEALYAIMLGISCARVPRDQDATVF